MARPTIRYDYDFGGFGVSVSSNRDLDDVGVGASWTGDLGEGSVTVGLGYYNYSEFTAVEPVRTVPPGEQWSAAIGGELGPVEGSVIYSTADSEGESGFTTLGAGLGAELEEAWAIDLYYIKVTDAFGTVGDFDGEDSYGLGVGYDLGGGAQVLGGIARTYARETVADFGIALAF